MMQFADTSSPVINWAVSGASTGYDFSLTVDPTLRYIYTGLFDVKTGSTDRVVSCFNYQTGAFNWG